MSKEVRPESADQNSESASIRYPVDELRKNQFRLAQQRRDLETASRRLQMAELEIQQIRDNAPVAYFVHDSEHKILEANRRAMAIFDSADPARLLHKPAIVQHLLTSEVFQLFDYHVRRVARLGKPFSVELSIGQQNSAGAGCIVLAETTSLETGLFQTVMVDITSQKKNDRERRDFEARMEQLQKLNVVHQLSAGIAHDFNNLLQSLTMQAELALLAARDATPAVRNGIQDMMQTVQRGSDLTGQLMAFSRKSPIERVHGELNQLVHNSISMIKRTIGNRIKVVFEPSPEPLGVWVDPVQLEQSLLNLCMNARDATTGDGTILIRTEPVTQTEPQDVNGLPIYCGPYSRLTVNDQGCGIAEENWRVLFEPFFTTKEVGQGTGLGLSIVYNILRQHEGAIQVRGSSDSGTTIEILLPRFQWKHSTRPTVSDREEKPAACQRLALVADDQSTIRNVLANLLETQGVKVFRAADGKEAIEVIDENPSIDIVLTDIVMPEIGGLEVCEYFRKRNLNGIVVLMSGHGDSVLDKNFLRVHNATFLAKPFQLATLEKKLALNGAT